MASNRTPEFRAEAVRVALTSGLPRKQVGPVRATMDFQARGIHDQSNGIARPRLRLLNRSAFSAPRQRREIRHRQVDFHHSHQ